MNTEPVIRLHLYFARETPDAVILRQGPNKVFRMIRWNRDTDAFEDGQWMRHKIYTDWCDLSPDGRHFLYYALDGKWGAASYGSYNALSRPPYFTALSLFPEGTTYSSGGRFLDNVHYVAAGGPDIIGCDDGLVRLYRKEPGRDCPSGLHLIDGNCVKIGKAKSALWTERLNMPVPESHTMALDHYDTQGGALYRRSGGEMELIRDFTDMTFEPIRAPYDWRGDPGGDPAAPPWHPLNGDAS